MALIQWSKEHRSLVLIFVMSLLCGCSKQVPTRPQAVPAAQQQLNAAAVQEAAYEQNPAAAMKALSVNPDDVNAHEALAHVYIGRSQYPAVVTQLREVLRLRPDDRASANLLALCLYKTGDKKGAFVEWKGLVKQNDKWGQVARKNLLRTH